MKKILFLVIFATSSLTLCAQDLLVRKSGEVENVKVIEVSPTEVKYKKINNDDAPIFIEKRGDIYSIKYQSGDVQRFKDTFSSDKTFTFYSDYGKKKRFTNEVDMYIQNGWGLGYKFREEFNPYVGCNFLSASYMSDFNDISKFGIVNVRLFGLRLYSPSFEKFRLYTELNIGYTFTYFYVEEIILGNGTYYNMTNTSQLISKYKEHCFGFDFSTGIQLNRLIAIGYNLNFLKNSDWKGMSHWGKISFIF